MHWRIGLSAAIGVETMGIAEFFLNMKAFNFSILYGRYAANSHTYYS